MSQKKTVPNQNTIVNSYNPKKDFVKTGIEAFQLFNAEKNISSEAFVLWQELRLLYHSVEPMALSPAYICSELYNDTSENTIRNVRKHIAKLKEAGWIKQINGTLCELVIPSGRNCEARADNNPEPRSPTPRNCEARVPGTDSTENRNCEALESRLDIVDVVDENIETNFNAANKKDDTAAQHCVIDSGLSRTQIIDLVKDINNTSMDDVDKLFNIVLAACKSYTNKPEKIIYKKDNHYDKFSFTAFFDRYSSAADNSDIVQTMGSNYQLRRKVIKYIVLLDWFDCGKVPV